MIEDITPIVITYNEEANIARTLDRLTWARRILVIDSGSSDGTLDIIRSYPRAEVIHRPFDEFASQCNFGIAQVTTTWVLSLDADYELSDELITRAALPASGRERPAATKLDSSTVSSDDRCAAHSTHRAPYYIARTGRATKTRVTAIGSLLRAKSCRSLGSSFTTIVSLSRVGSPPSSGMPARTLSIYWRRTAKRSVGPIGSGSPSGLRRLQFLYTRSSLRDAWSTGGLVGITRFSGLSPKQCSRLNFSTDDFGGSFERKPV